MPKSPVKYDDRLNVPIESEFKRKFKELAEARGTNMTEAARLAVKIFYEKLEDKDGMTLEEILINGFSKHI